MDWDIWNFKISRVCYSPTKISEGDGFQIHSTNPSIQTTLEGFATMDFKPVHKSLNPKCNQNLFVFKLLDFYTEDLLIIMSLNWFLLSGVHFLSKTLLVDHSSGIGPLQKYRTLATTLPMGGFLLHFHDTWLPDLFGWFIIYYVY